eukprot:TRINITY_DN7343_c0_g1_i1.p1 TRINITY_DN7343_c0_g1~~TRINITY_DN7343_c0_g1_i1.p1  ORF type:complete len:429 (-),score=85.00 TRINITY_DN7343_c0_g1_i1:23-1309(-)
MTSQFSFGGTTLGAPAASTGFAFGSNAAAPSSSSGFAFNSAPSTAAPTGSLFGNNAPSSNASSFTAFNPSAPSTNLFGSTAPSSTAPAPSSGGFSTGFGGNTSFGGFGTAPSSGMNPPASSGGFGTGFGSTTGTTSGGFNPSGSSSGSNLFGSSTAPPSNNNFGFLGSSAPSWGAPPTAAPNAKPAPPTPQQKITFVSEAYNVEGADCRFKHMLYNRVDDPSAYVKPSNVDQRLWDQAVEANPDPKRLIPVLAVGFAQLKTRIQSQEEEKERQMKQLNEVQSVLAALQRKQELDNLPGIDDCKRKHVILNHRILKLMKKIEVLRYKSFSLTQEEENFKNRLVTIQRALSNPSSYRSKLNELTALVNRQEERLLSAPNFAVNIPEEQLEKISEHLQSETKALGVLEDMTKKDLRDANIMIEGLKSATSY